MYFKSIVINVRFGKYADMIAAISDRASFGD